MLGAKALLFVPEADLEELKKTLAITGRSCSSSPTRPTWSRSSA